MTQPITRCVCSLLIPACVLVACSDDSSSASTGVGGADAAAAAGSGGTANEGGLDVASGGKAGSAGAAGSAGGSAGTAGSSAGGGGSAGQGGAAGEAGAAGHPQVGDTDAKGRVLTFADEFEGAQIDRTVWGNEIGQIRNEEEQYYTDADKNQFIDQGNLVIKGIPESYQGGNYTSASLTTEGHRSFKFGRIEARIRVPGAKGSWPAFWLLPADKPKYDGMPPYGSWWPAGGEIDIMEFVSQTPKTVYGTAHFLKNNAHASSGSNVELSAPVSDDYHVFAIEWTPAVIAWFVDDTSYHSFDISQPIDGLSPFQDSFYLILNLAIGGTWPEDPDPAQYPQEMRVDWVRVWQTP